MKVWSFSHSHCISLFVEAFSQCQCLKHVRVQLVSISKPDSRMVCFHQDERIEQEIFFATTQSLVIGGRDPRADLVEHHLPDRKDHGYSGGCNGEPPSEVLVRQL